MNREMINRMKTAGEYQKKAIRALLPERMGGHLDVIENEIKMMAMEIMADMMRECRKSGSREEEQAQENVSGVKKVDIM